MIQALGFLDVGDKALNDGGWGLCKYPSSNTSAAQPPKKTVDVALKHHEVSLVTSNNAEFYQNPSLGLTAELLSQVGPRSLGPTSRTPLPNQPLEP